MLPSSTSLHFFPSWHSQEEKPHCLCFVHFWTLPIFLLLAAMALTQSARLPGPSWDEEVVPALQQRMFTETSLIVDFRLITSQVWRAKVEPCNREYQLFFLLPFLAIAAKVQHRQSLPPLRLTTL